MSIVTAIVCLTDLVGTSYSSVAQNDTATTVDISTDDVDNDNGNWGLLGLLGLVGFIR